MVLGGVTPNVALLYRLEVKIIVSMGIMHYATDYIKNLLVSSVCLVKKWNYRYFVNIHDYCRV